MKTDNQIRVELEDLLLEIQGEIDYLMDEDRVPKPLEFDHGARLMMSSCEMIIETAFDLARLQLEVKANGNR